MVGPLMTMKSADISMIHNEEFSLEIIFYDSHNYKVECLTQ